jgi:TrmH RNA methyltransferase
MKKPTVSRPPGRRRPDDERRELRYYGTACCEALFRARRDDIVRIYLEERLLPAFGPLLKWAAAQRKAYHIVTAAELEKITESIHHQGICVLARERLPLAFDALEQRLHDDGAPMLLAYLDGVENPHNLGAILRTCAHFGVGAVLGPKDALPRLSPSACRVAEGGAESVDLVPLDDPAARLTRLRTLGFRVVSTAVDGGRPLYRHRFAARVVLVMGAEVEGVSPALRTRADDLLTIPGTGAVESLNVGVAFAVLAAEFYRQHAAKT